MTEDYKELLERLEADRLPECSFDEGITWVTDDVVVAETFTRAATAIRALQAERDALRSALGDKSVLRLDAGCGLHILLRAKAKPSELVLTRALTGSVERFWHPIRFTHIGTLTEDGWIEPPEGGWDTNPAPGMVVEWRAADGFSGRTEAHRLNWAGYATSPVVAFRPAQSEAEAMDLEMVMLEEASAGPDLPSIAQPEPATGGEVDEWADLRHFAEGGGSMVTRPQRARARKAMRQALAALGKTSRESEHG